jgi:HPr kinase/phosphorylase
VIELENRLIGKDYDRMGDKEETMEYLGISVPKITIPVSPGRNLAIIIEVAARNERLKRMGYDASQELIEQAMGKL